MLRLEEERLKVVAGWAGRRLLAAQVAADDRQRCSAGHEWVSYGGAGESSLVPNYCTGWLNPDRARIFRPPRGRRLGRAKRCPKNGVRVPFAVIERHSDPFVPAIRCRFSRRFLY